MDLSKKEKHPVTYLNRKELCNNKLYKMLSDSTALLRITNNQLNLFEKKDLAWRNVENDAFYNTSERCYYPYKGF